MRYTLCPPWNSFWSKRGRLNIQINIVEFHLLSASGYLISFESVMIFCQMTILSSQVNLRSCSNSFQQICFKEEPFAVEETYVGGSFDFQVLSIYISENYLVLMCCCFCHTMTPVQTSIFVVLYSSLIFIELVEHFPPLIIFYICSIPIVVGPTFISLIKHLFLLLVEPLLPGIESLKVQIVTGFKRLMLSTLLGLGQTEIQGHQIAHPFERVLTIHYNE